MDVCFHRGPTFVEHGVTLFLRALEIKIYIYINRHVNMPCKQVSVCIGAPLGNLEGIRWPGLFERKGKVYLGFFLSWAQNKLRF
jgi:hypothetical protein